MKTQGYVKLMLVSDSIAYVKNSVKGTISYPESKQGAYFDETNEEFKASNPGELNGLIGNNQ